MHIVLVAIQLDIIQQTLVETIHALVSPTRIKRFFFTKSFMKTCKIKAYILMNRRYRKKKKKEKENNNPFQLQFKTSRTSQVSLMIKTCPRAPHSKYNKLNNITFGFAIRMMALQPMEFCSF